VLVRLTSILIDIHKISILKSPFCYFVVVLLVLPGIRIRMNMNLSSAINVLRNLNVLCVLLFK